MSSSAIRFDVVIAQARGGSCEALGRLLQRYRNYLYLLAAAQIGRRIARRISASDVVQETMLAAHRDFAEFRGHSSAELTSWLKTILSRSLLREFDRHLKAEKRDMRREISYDTVVGGLESSCAAAATLVGSRQSDPAQIVSADEESRRVADLVAELPDVYRKVVTLKIFSELETAEIASHMQRSPQAIRLLWMRALRKLKRMYEERYD